MTKTFTYSQNAKTIRKKTFSGFQKFILSTLWIVASAVMIGGIIMQQQNLIPNNTFILLAIIFIPLLGAFGIAIYMAFHPQGPEADFKLPAIELDLNDSSVVKGTIQTKSGEAHDVEVRVPNVYGASTNLLDSAPDISSSSGLAHDEMIIMAIEEVQKIYPECFWKNQESLKII